MAKVEIDSKKGIAIIKFTKSEEPLAKLLSSFFDPKAIVSPTINDSFFKNIRQKAFPKLELDLDHSSVSKEVILSILKIVDEVK